MERYCLLLAFLLTSCTVVDAPVSVSTLPGAETAVLITETPLFDPVPKVSEGLATKENVSIGPMSLVERAARKATVKVLVPGGGYGTGTYYVYKGFHLILTASHVVDSVGVKEYEILTSEDERAPANVVYFNSDLDAAWLILSNPLKTREALSFRPAMARPSVGDAVYYTGYPAQHEMLSLRGYIAGFEKDDPLGDTENYILNAYGWMGCSGSSVFNRHGSVLGVLWGVDVRAPWGYPQVVENITWVGPAKDIDMRVLLDGACKAKRGNAVCDQHELSRLKERLSK